MYYLGIDWGGTSIKAGVVDHRGRLLYHKTLASVAFRKKDVFIESVRAIAEGLGRSHNIKAVGIGAPGIIDTKRGFIYYLPNIPGWENYPLQDILGKKLKLPVYIDNDANVFALAEARLGAAQGVGRALFLTIGTGLGGAIILDGEIVKGRTSACEFGHVPVSLRGRTCSCGGKGCIEAYVGNKYLLTRYKKLKKGKTRAGEVKHIFARALRGEKQALMVWDEFSYALGMFLAGMINIFNPEKIIFGGGIAGAFTLFKPLVLRVLQAQAIQPHLKGLRLVKAQLRSPGIIGAALLAKENVAH